MIHDTYKKKDPRTRFNRVGKQKNQISKDIQYYTCETHNIGLSNNILINNFFAIMTPAC